MMGLGNHSGIARQGALLEALTSALQFFEKPRNSATTTRRVNVLNVNEASFAFGVLYGASKGIPEGYVVSGKIPADQEFVNFDSERPYIEFGIVPQDSTAAVFTFSDGTTRPSQRVPTAAEVPYDPDAFPPSAANLPIGELKGVRRGSSRPASA